MYNNMNQIKNVKSLDELVKYNELLRYTCKVAISKIHYNDIIQDVYLRSKKYFDQGKTLNGGYLVMMMKSIHLDNMKKRKLNDQQLMDIESRYDPNKWEDIDNNIIKMDNLLCSLLSISDVEFYKYLKTNTEKKTANEFNMSVSNVKKKSKKIRDKIENNLKNNKLF